MSQCAITTRDNPYDPFTQFRQWFVFDITKGYNTCDYLARIAKTSKQMSDTECDEEVERAIDEILKYDPLNRYMKVVADESKLKDKNPPGDIKS